MMRSGYSRRRRLAKRHGRKHAEHAAVDAGRQLVDPEGSVMLVRGRIASMQAELSLS